LVSVEFEGHRASLETTYEIEEKTWYTCVIVGEEVSTVLPHKLPLYRPESSRDDLITDNLKLFTGKKTAVVKQILTKLINKASKHKQDIDQLVLGPLPTAEEVARKLEEDNRRKKAFEDEIAAEEAKKRELEADEEAAKKAELAEIEKYCKILRNEDGNSTPELIFTAQLGLKFIMLPTFARLGEKKALVLNKLAIVDYLTITHNLLRYGVKIWRYDWDDAYYVSDPDDIILKQTIADIQAAVEVHYEKIIDKEGNTEDVCVKYNGNFTGDREQIISQASYSGLVFTRSPFNQYPDYINAKNGVLKLDYENRTVELIGKKPGFMFNYCIDAEYDPKANARPIDKFIEEVVGPHQKDIIYQMPAIALRDIDMELESSKIAYFIIGPKHAGKNQLIRLNIDFLGRRNITTIPMREIVEDKFVLASMEGKIMNLNDELPVSIPISESSQLKSLTGGKHHSINPKGIQGYQGSISALQVFAGNQFPKCNVPESDDAFWGRWDVIHCNNQFKVNEKFAKTLFTPQNLSGFFNRVIEKLFDIHDNGVKRLMTAEQVYDEWQYSSSTVYRFVQDTMVKTTTPQTYIKSTLHQEYLKWCTTNNIDVEKTVTEADSFGKEILRMCKAESVKSGFNHAYKMFRSFKQLNTPTVNSGVESIAPEPISVADDWGQHSN